ncbi:MAG: Aminobenzoyl-glutamate transport protein, partial [uncultured Friedmanniella sp.]
EHDAARPARHPGRQGPGRGRTGRQQAARPVHAVPRPVRRRRPGLDGDGIGRHAGDRAGGRRARRRAGPVLRPGAHLADVEPRRELHRLPPAGHRADDPAGGHRRRADRAAGRGGPGAARLGAPVAAALRRRDRRDQRLGDGRRGDDRRAAAGGDGLQGRRPAPGRRARRRLRGGGCGLLDLAADHQPGRALRRDHQRGDAGSARPGCGGDAGVELLVQPRVLARAGAGRRVRHRPGDRAADEPAGGAPGAGGGGRRRPRLHRRGGRGSAERAPGTAERHPGAPREAVPRGRAGRPARPRGGDDHGVRLAGLALAQPGGRVPAEVAAARLGGLRRVPAVPGPGPGLRLRRRHADPRRRRGQGDGPGHQGHELVHRAGLHAGPVHRAVQLVRRRLGPRGRGGGGAAVDRPDRVPGHPLLHPAVLPAEPVHRLGLVDVDPGRRGLRAAVRPAGLRAGLRPGRLPGRGLRDAGDHADEPLHLRVPHAAQAVRAAGRSRYGDLADAALRRPVLARLGARAGRLLPLRAGHGARRRHPDRGV